MKTSLRRQDITPLKHLLPVDTKEGRRLCDPQPLQHLTANQVWYFPYPVEVMLPCE